jgi:hypothetical protein
VTVVAEMEVSTEVAVDVSVEEKMRVDRVVLVTKMVEAGSVVAEMVTVDVDGVTPRQLQARERRDAGWWMRFSLTREEQVACKPRFFSVMAGKGRIVVEVTSVVVNEVLQVVDVSAVVVSSVVVVNVMEVSVTVNDSIGVTVVSVVVTGSAVRKSAQNSTAWAFRSATQSGDT